MKKIVVVVIALLSLLNAFLLVKNHKDVSSVFGFDFRLRYNEMKCVLEGTDPFLIWNGSVLSPTYKPLPSDMPITTCVSRFGKYDFLDDQFNLVHSYPTWSYTFLMPMALLPRGIATMVYAVIELVCALILFAAAFRWGFVRRGKYWEGWLCLLVSLFVLRWMEVCIYMVNYGVLVAGSMLGMIVCLNRRHDIMAGFCWAFMMVKPQLGLLFVVPLLMCGKWKTVVTAVATCLVASIPPAVLCGRSPIAMIFSIVEYGRIYQFDGSLGKALDVASGMPLVPACIAGVLFPFVNTWGVFAFNALLGVVGCGVATWFLRRHEDWLFRLLPSVFFCLLWTVARGHDKVCLIFVYIGAALALLRLLDKLDEQRAKGVPSLNEH